ncbi:MAG TPA: hypothetical protein PKD27_02780, partial [Tepidiformaceae bacterium]|nr:hypothetical protein [Tepidiformaceae bacterium]
MTALPSITRLTPEELDEVIIELGQPRYRADQLLKSIYQASPAAFADVVQVPAALRQQLEERFSLAAAEEVRRG